jgi:hypothetical protein
VVQLIVAPDEVIELAETPEITGPVVFSTMTEMLLLAVFPDVSVAIAVSVWEPLLTLVLFQETE